MSPNLIRLAAGAVAMLGGAAFGYVQFQNQMAATDRAMLISAGGPSGATVAPPEAGGGRGPAPGGSPRGPVRQASGPVERGGAAVTDIVLLAAALSLPQPGPAQTAVDRGVPTPAAPRDPVAPAPLAPVRVAAVPQIAGSTSGEEEAYSPFGLGCNVTMTAEARPGAVVAVDVQAPCAAGRPVTLRHAGLILDLATDAMGHARLDLPVLETPAEVTVVSAGRAARATVDVPDLSAYARVGIAWRGDGAPELHARADRTATPVRAGEPPATVGVLTSLGDLQGGAAARIYTLPYAAMSGPVDLSVEAPAGAAGCGGALALRMIRAEPRGPAALTDVTVDLPACGAGGERLVLQNLLPDLTMPPY